MRPKFIQAMYFEGRILLFEEYGDVYEYSPRLTEWRLLSVSPWPIPREWDEPAKMVSHKDGNPRNNDLSNLEIKDQPK